MRTEQFFSSFKIFFLQKNNFAYCLILKTLIHISYYVLITIISCVNEAPRRSIAKSQPTLKTVLLRSDNYFAPNTSVGEFTD